MKTKIKVKNKKFETTILIKKNHILSFIKKITDKNEKVYCILDSKIKYKINLKDISNINIISIKCGEEIKSIDQYEKLIKKLIQLDINRKSILIAIGGGTLGDLVGFVASTLLRGLEFYLIPTTLLSQVDSSIGGKNGINSSYGKNLIGTFYQPKKVLIDISILNTLPKREIKAGYSEIVKHALIKDYRFFCWLEKHVEEVLDLKTSIVEEAIYKSIMIKLYYVKKDEKEMLIDSNSRAMLNFGHTIGHAIESCYNYTKLNHGEAISVGMITEAKISNNLGLLSNDQLNRIILHFKNNKLKIFDKILNEKNFTDKMVKDKKNFTNNINLALIDRIGSSIFYKKLDKNKINEILKKI